MTRPPARRHSPSHGEPTLPIIAQHVLRWRIGLLALAASSLLFADGAGAQVAPDGPQARPTPIHCPDPEPEEQRGEVTRTRGGRIALRRGHALEVPREAMREARDAPSFMVRRRASDHLMVEVEAMNGTGRYEFMQPALLTLNWSACPDPGDPELLQVFQVEPATDSILAGPLPVVRRTRQSITVRLDHLSAYVIAIP